MVHTFYGSMNQHKLIFNLLYIKVTTVNNIYYLQQRNLSHRGPEVIFCRIRQTGYNVCGNHCQLSIQMLTMYKYHAKKILFWLVNSDFL